MRKRLFTYDVGDGPAVLVNPEIVESSGEWVYDEGCLSVPGFHFEIVRPKLVTVRGVDLDGNEVVIEGDELLGRLIQHEIDHLDGMLLVERLEPDARKEAMRELRKVDFTAVAARRRRRPPALTPDARIPVRIVFLGTPADAVPPLPGPARRRSRGRARRDPARPAPGPRRRARPEPGQGGRGVARAPGPDARARG